MKILLVDDDSSVRMALSMVLKGMEMEVILAANGKEALEVLLTETVDLVFCDINMPVMDGLEFGRCLRAKESGADIPLVYMTGSQPKEFEEEIKRLNVAGFLWKPLGIQQIRAEVEKARNTKR